MVDHIQHKQDLLRDRTGDMVLPDLPPRTEAVFARFAQRLYLRRWLVALTAMVVLLFVAAYQLPLQPALIGFGVIAVGAGILPREGILRSVSLSLGENEREAATRIIHGMLDGLPAPAMLLSAPGQVVSYNGQAKESFTSLRQNEHISRFIRDPRVLDGVSSVSPTLRPHQIVAYEERVPIEKHMEATIAWIGPVTSKGHPNTPAILLYLRDLTEQERVDQLRSDFIANASHELRTPLASLVGFIETLQGAAKEDPAARERFLEIMRRQAQRMSRLIDNLLSLSHIEMRLHLKPQARVDLNEVAKHVTATLEPLAGKTGVTLHLSMLVDGAWVHGDRDELVQVLSNLVENGIKYGKNGGNVWIAIEKQRSTAEEMLRLLVRDDGLGIDEKHLPRLTERFYRANDNGGEKSGTGLGLAIVKHVINRHRGELNISSELGKGSIFTISLRQAAA